MLPAEFVRGDDPQVGWVGTPAHQLGALIGGGALDAEARN